MQLIASRARPTYDLRIIVLLQDFQRTEIMFKFAGTLWAAKGRKGLLSLLKVLDGRGGS